MPKLPMLITMSAELIFKIQKGDQTAFGEFYDHYSPLVYSVALRILQKSEDANDLLQEIFIRVWQKAVQYKPAKGKPEAWLITMTRSRAIDMIRSRRRLSRKADKLREETADRELQEANDIKENRFMQLTLDWGFKKISTDERKVLELAYFDGYVHKEIAERLGIPEGTVKTRIRSGLNKLRQAFSRRGWENSTT